MADVADVETAHSLDEHGITEVNPTRRQWPVTQPIGEAYFRAGCRGLLTPSAAHVGGKVLVIFRPTRDLAGLSAMPPPNRYHELPALPEGLRI